MDRFPEAFRRFEEVVDIRRIESFRQLRLAFAYWAGWKWHDTYMQNRALAVEARRLGIPVFIERRPVVRFHGHPTVTWRHETVSVKGRPQERYRNLKTGRFIKKPKKIETGFVKKSCVKKSLQERFNRGNSLISFRGIAWVNVQP